MSKLTLYCLIFVLSVLVSSVSQIMLKISANKTYPNPMAEYLNPLVITAYILFFSCTAITMYALKVVPLAYAPVLEATGYIFVAIMGRFILKEKMPQKKIIGFILILIGVIVYVY